MMVVKHPFYSKGFVEDHFLDDVVLDTGCSRTLVRRDLVRENRLNSEKSVVVHCAHGDTREYPVANVEISVQGRVIMVEVAVSDKLPHAILLGTDVLELMSWLKKDQVLMVVTRSQASRLSGSQPGQESGKQEVSSSDIEVEERSATSDGAANGIERVETEGILVRMASQEFLLLACLEIQSI